MSTLNNNCSWKIQKLDYKVMLGERHMELKSGSYTVLSHLTGQNDPQIASSINN